MKNKFIILMAYLMSLSALTIDAVLPALGDIQRDLGVQDSNDMQLVISTVFLGMAFGLMLYGPLSDAYGRKRPLYFGISLFVAGAALSFFSQDFEIMLFGRVLQGFGVAAARVVSVAMIRDRFSGVEMAKTMSLIMVFFIIVPALAPTLGQVILNVSKWQSIFGLLIILGLLAMAALKFQQEETLSVEDRISFSVRNLFNGIKETLWNPISRGYTIASGLVFGAFVAYLSLAQQILQVQYNLGEHFSYYFGGLALFIGLSSYLNSRLVIKYGMRRLSRISLVSIAILAALYLLVLKSSGGETALWTFLLYMGFSFLFVGVLFGNLNALAIEPLGHIAGIANSVISCVQTFLSVGVGAIVGQLYDGTVTPLVIAFFVLSILSFSVITMWTSED